MEKKKTFELYTNNETIINVLNNFKNNRYVLHFEGYVL